jgi:hypothetical protein
MILQYQVRCIFHFIRYFPKAILLKAIFSGISATSLPTMTGEKGEEISAHLIHNGNLYRKCAHRGIRWAHHSG